MVVTCGVNCAGLSLGAQLEAALSNKLAAWRACLAFLRHTEVSGTADAI